MLHRFITLNTPCVKHSRTFISTSHAKAMNIFQLRPTPTNASFPTVIRSRLLKTFAARVQREWLSSHRLAADKFLCSHLHWNDWSSSDQYRSLVVLTYRQPKSPLSPSQFGQFPVRGGRAGGEGGRGRGDQLRKGETQGPLSFVCVFCCLCFVFVCCVLFLFVVTDGPQIPPGGRGPIRMTPENTHFWSLRKKR